MMDRSKFLKCAAVVATTLAVSPQLLTAQKLNGTLIQRPIPSSGEMIPAIGLAFSNHPSCADHGALKEVVKTFADNGGRLIDASLANAASEQFHFTAANELGLGNKVFWAARGFVPGPNASAAGVKTQIDSLLAKSKASNIDIAWVGAAADPSLLAALKEEKKAGRIKYIGVQTIVVKNQAAQLEAIMRNEPIDFIGIDYDIGNRSAEETILPLALEKKIGVIAFFPYGNNSGVSCGSLSLNLFARVGNRPVPAWAAEFDAKTWSQFFGKYVLGHPAVTAARVGTTKPNHMLDNMQGGVGRLPSQAMRQRMAALIDSIPAPVPPQRGQAPSPAQAPGISLPTAILDRYVGEWKTPAGNPVIFRREGASLLVKPTNLPELPLNARSETRFQDPRGPVFEFQVDAQGNVTGLVLEQGNPVQRMTLTRK